MRPDPAMLGIHENEVERVEALVGAQPDELVALHVYIGLEAVVVAAAQFRIEPVGGNDEVIACEEVAVGLDLDLELQVDAEVAPAVLQDVEEPLAADADEAVTARGDRKSTRLNSSH